MCTHACVCVCFSLSSQYVGLQFVYQDGAVKPFPNIKQPYRVSVCLLVQVRLAVGGKFSFSVLVREITINTNNIL